MFWKPAGLKFYLSRQPADMRNGFDGLSGLVSNGLAQNPLSGDVFIFLNKPKNRIKLLLWDGDGFWIFYKRLEKGTFQIPKFHNQSESVELSYEALFMMLQGIDLEGIKRRKRYQIPVIAK